MELVVKSNGQLEMNDVNIVFRNFSGVGDQYNREGDRNFCVVIDDEDIYENLVSAGWNVRRKDTMDGDPFMYMKVKVKFKDGRGPSVYLRVGDHMRKLSEDTVGIIDQIDIENVDLDIRPYDWSLKDGSSGRAAYLTAMCVTQRVDRFAAKYELEEAEVIPYVDEGIDELPF